MLLSSLSYICWQFGVLKQLYLFSLKCWANVAQIHFSNQMTALKLNSGDWDKDLVTGSLFGRWKSRKREQGRRKAKRDCITELLAVANNWGSSPCRTKYWVGQGGHSGFPIASYRRIRMNLLANSIRCASELLLWRIEAGTPTLISCRSCPRMVALLDFPGGSDCNEFICNAGDLGSIPGSGRAPGEDKGYLLQYSCLENSMDRGAWWAIVHGVAKSWTGLSH